MTLYDLLPRDENFSSNHLLGRFPDYGEGQCLTLLQTLPPPRLRTEAGSSEHV
jgi:hypothetical protein